jgi:hypothetical protein
MKRVTFLTTQEAARLVGCHASTINNRVAKGHLQPTARAGFFARALCLWTEDQLPEIRRAVMEHARREPSEREKRTARRGGWVL